MDWRSSGSVGSIPGLVKRSSWYTDRQDGAHSCCHSPSRLQLPAENCANVLQNRGSANSLVEAVSKLYCMSRRFFFFCHKGNGSDHPKVIFELPEVANHKINYSSKVKPEDNGVCCHHFIKKYIFVIIQPNSSEAVLVF